MKANAELKMFSSEFAVHRAEDRHNASVFSHISGDNTETDLDGLTEMAA